MLAFHPRCRDHLVIVLVILIKIVVVLSIDLDKSPVIEDDNVVVTVQGVDGAPFHLEEKVQTATVARGQQAS